MSNIGYQGVRIDRDSQGGYSLHASTLKREVVDDRQSGGVRGWRSMLGRRGAVGRSMPIRFYALPRQLRLRNRPALVTMTHVGFGPRTSSDSGRCGVASCHGHEQGVQQVQLRHAGCPVFPG
jgi:hypothetical protein